MYYFEAKRHALWDKETLREFELNDDAALLLSSLLVPGSAPAKPEDVDALLSALKACGIRLEDIRVFEGLARSLQTPIVHIIKNCNSRCEICDCWKTDGTVFISAHSLQGFWVEACEAGAESVMVSGGEPLMHPELLDILADIHAAGLCVELNTNGILLNKLPGLDQAGIEAIVVSVDGFDAMSYKAIRGVDAFARVARNIKEFHGRSPRTLLGARVTVTDYCLGHLEDAIEFALENDVDVVSFSPLDVFSESFARTMTKSRSDLMMARFLPTLSTVDELLDRFEHKRKTYEVVADAAARGIFAWGPNDFVRCLRYYRNILDQDSDVSSKLGTFEPCDFPRSSLVVDYDGAIRPCFYGPRLCDVEEFRGEAWNPVALTSLMMESRVCAGCRGKVFCDV